MLTPRSLHLSDTIYRCSNCTADDEDLQEILPQELVKSSKRRKLSAKKWQAKPAEVVSNSSIPCCTHAACQVADQASARLCDCRMLTTVSVAADMLER